MKRKIRLPIGETDFREIRTGGYYYIDKTASISTLIRDGAKSILFTRPRRFGKTTFQSMLKSFFDIREDNKDIFQGLAVMNDKEASFILHSRTSMGCLLIQHSASSNLR